MVIDICQERQKILDENGHILVTGGPGSGKTTIALKKAIIFIENKISSGQSVLFLSFSRAAVTRIINSSIDEMPKKYISILSIQTFHSFFWQIIKAHGYLLGCPKKLSILLPPDEKALNLGMKDDHQNWKSWLAERERLFKEDGKIAFDLFSGKCLEILSKSATIRKLIGDHYPLIIVDEAQDTNEEQWNCIKLLAPICQLLCLADLEQQIYDFRQGVNAERVNNILSQINPLRIDFGSQNNRSSGLEILQFGDDILRNTPKNEAYEGVSKISYCPQVEYRNAAIKRAVGQIYKYIKKSTDKFPSSVAILTSTNRGVTTIANALCLGKKEIPHRVLYDETDAHLSSRIIAFFLEPKMEVNDSINIAITLRLLADVYLAKGTKMAQQKANKWLLIANKIESNQAFRKIKIIKKLKSLFSEIRSSYFEGNPHRDWYRVRQWLRQFGIVEFRDLDVAVQHLTAFNKGRAAANDLASVWQTYGYYHDARRVMDKALAIELLLSYENEDTGIHVMTIHKSKGKQFDAVILFDESRICPFELYHDQLPYVKSRKLLRVGITRARSHVLLLVDSFNPSLLLQGFILNEI
jgi:DNA helicase-2/ATP-dependent DNA helicase PcrA